MTLGKNLQDLRKEAGLSQEQVAQQLFVSRQTVSKWENNLAEPGVENLKTLARLFGVTLDQLMGLETASQRPEQKEAELLSWEYPLYAGLYLIVCVRHMLYALNTYGAANLPVSLIAVLLGLVLRYPAMWVILECTLAVGAVFDGMILLSDPERGVLGFLLQLIYLWVVSRKTIRQEFHVSR